MANRKSQPCEPGCTCRKHPAGAVDNAPFREAFEHMRGKANDARAVDKQVATEAGFTRRHRPRGPEGPEYDIADTSALYKALGIRPTRKGKYVSYRKTISAETALRLRDALNLDPTEAPV